MDFLLISFYGAFFYFELLVATGTYWFPHSTLIVWGKMSSIWAVAV